MRCELFIGKIHRCGVVIARFSGHAVTFTAGIPYNFLKKDSADWSSKTIGHLTGDAALLVLTEICLPSQSRSLENGS